MARVIREEMDYVKKRFQRVHDIIRDVDIEAELWSGLYGPYYKELEDQLAKLNKQEDGTK